MPHVITSGCIGIKEHACVEVCPMECIYDGGDQFLIYPNECCDCTGCIPVCPVSAIFPEEDVPAAEFHSIAKNRDFFS